MNDLHDLGWSELEEIWRDEPAAEAQESLRALCRRVHRRRRLGAWLVAGEVATGVAFTVLAFHLLERHGGMLGRTTFGAVIAFVLTAAGFAWWARRGVWRGTARQPDEYMDLERRQLESRLRAARLGAWLLALELSFFAVWIPWARPGSLVASYLFALAWSAPFALALHGLRTRARRRLRALERLRHELRSEPPE